MHLASVHPEFLHERVAMRRGAVRRGGAGGGAGERIANVCFSALGDSHDVNLSRALYSALMMNWARRYVALFADR